MSESATMLQARAQPSPGKCEKRYQADRGGRHQDRPGHLLRRGYLSKASCPVRAIMSTRTLAARSHPQAGWRSKETPPVHLRPAGKSPAPPTGACSPSSSTCAAQT